jgi:hypothetical protein
MSEKMADVTVHIDETISHNERESLRDKVLQQTGVMAAACRDEKPHLMMVEYDPDAVSSRDILKIVKSAGVHAELVGL